MALSPGQFRLTAALGLLGVLCGCIYWVSRYQQQHRVVDRAYGPSFRTAGPVGRATVAGQVLGVDGKPAHADVSVLTELNQMPIRGGPMRGRRVAEARTDGGRFSLPSVAAGHYVVVARAVGADEATDASGLWAAAEVDPTDDHPAAVRLQLRRSGSLAGQIRLEPSAGTRPFDLTNAVITLEPADGEAKAALLDGLPRVYPSGTGHFVLPDLPPGHYRISAELGPPWMIDRVTAAGIDGLDQPIAVAPGGYVNDLLIAATDVPSLVEGQVLDGDGHGAAFALVFVFGADPATRSSRRTQAVRANGVGRFTVTGLPSGDYLVGLATGTDPGAWYSPGFFAQLTPSASRVRVAAGTTRSAVVGGRPK
jgi:hypothetical protein